MFALRAAVNHISVTCIEHRGSGKCNALAFWASFGAKPHKNIEYDRRKKSITISKLNIFSVILAALKFIYTYQKRDKLPPDLGEMTAITFVVCLPLVLIGCGWFYCAALFSLRSSGLFLFTKTNRESHNN